MTDEELVTAQLLRLAGQTLDPPADRTRRVREAVRREWHAHRRRRTIQRVAAVIVAAGVAATVAILVWIDRSGPAAPPRVDTVVAVSERLQGEPVLVGGNGAAHHPWPLAESSPVRPGDIVSTDAASRAAFRTADGTAVRIDRMSRVRFLGPALIEVLSGATYVTTSDRSHGFAVRTVMGVVRDVGTQFEVRVSGTSVRLRVRTGRVAIRRGTAETPVVAGTETTVTTSGIKVRQVSAFGAEWAWTAGLAVPFAIDGRPLRAFLEHMAAEEGWRLRYADPALADIADRIMLHGSVDGLSAGDAVRVALATSGLRYRLSDGELLVSRASDGQ
jgi:ferric-dicitrate binding protein FerR (iron transport regulator)